MSCILEFLGENIAGIDDTQDMVDVYITIDCGFADLAFVEIDVFHSLVCELSWKCCRNVVDMSSRQTYFA